MPQVRLYDANGQFLADVGCIPEPQDRPAVAFWGQRFFMRQPETGEYREVQAMPCWTIPPVS